jgi:hypothetical protein
MVGEFVPPCWAKLVIVGGDAAYGSKANIAMVKAREKADPARRWSFVFAIARNLEDRGGAIAQKPRDPYTSQVLPMHPGAQTRVCGA